MKVKKIHFNWFQTSNGQDSGEDYSFYEVGVLGVSEIIENEPHNGLQVWNYIIKFNNHTVVRIFNPNYVEYFKSKN